MLINPVNKIALFALLTMFFSAFSSAQELDAEASRDAGDDYASALRIRVNTPLDKPKGRTMSWRGSVSSNDRIDAFKFSPTPVKGQIIMLAVQSEAGPLEVRIIDRRSGSILVEAEKVGDTYGAIFMPQTGVLVTIGFVEGDTNQPYHAGIVFSKPEEMGIPSQDAATKAFAEAMKRKPTMKGLPEGFSLIVPKDKDAKKDDDGSDRDG